MTGQFYLQIYLLMEWKFVYPFLGTKVKFVYIKYKFYEATANIFFISMISNRIISNIYNFAELIRKAKKKHEFTYF